MSRYELILKDLISKIDDTKPLMHGTAENFMKFSEQPQRRASNWVRGKAGVYLTDKPEVAESFARHSGMSGSLGPYIESEDIDYVENVLRKIGYDEPDIDEILDLQELSESDLKNISEYLIGKGKPLYGHSAEGKSRFLNYLALQRPIAGVDVAEGISVGRKNKMPLVYEAEVKGNVLDLTKGTPSDLRKAIGGDFDYGAYPRQISARTMHDFDINKIKPILKDQDIKLLKINDAFESGGQSFYAPNVEDVRILSKKNPFFYGGAAIDPIKQLGDIVESYRKAQEKVADVVTEKVSEPFGGATEEQKMIMRFGLDPVNLVPGAAGLGLSGLEMAVKK